MSDSISNLRVHFYGIQGSGTVFPSRRERLAYLVQHETETVSHVFDDLARFADEEGRLSCSLEQLLGEPLSRRAIQRYRARLGVPEPRVYGGWTTCVRVETADGHDIVLDCGSGFRNCANELQFKWGDAPARQLHILGTHSHYDHTEGFDQAAVCFDPRNTIQIYGNHQFLHALDLNLGIFTHNVTEDHLGVQTPLYFELMPAKFEACEIRDLGSDPAPVGDALAGRYHDLREPLQFGKTTVSMTEVFHPAPCLAYRFEREGKAFVFCTDHELFRGDDDDPRHAPSQAAEARVREMAQGVELLYRDGQFFHVEYDGLQGIGTGGPVSRQGWGHSCVEDVMDMAESCNVKRTLIGHHDPNRDWSERNWIDETLARRSEQTGLRFELAQAETVVDL